jgi:sRNA-binding protein
MTEKLSKFKTNCHRVMDTWLLKQYPSVFSYTAPIPLEIGIAKELLAQLPEDITASDFKHTISWYCGRTLYLQAVLKHSQRINLQGELVGEITELDKSSAQERLDNKGKKKTEPKKDKPAVKTSVTPEPIVTPEIMQPTEETKPAKLTLKRKTVEPTAEATPVKAEPIAPAKVTNGNIATAKGLKVTMVIDPASVPNVDSTGLKKVTLTINVANTDIQVTTDINAKSYRKALSSIEEFGVDGCNVIIQGSMKQYGVIDDAGLVVQPKKIASSEA